MRTLWELYRVEVTWFTRNRVSQPLLQKILTFSTVQFFSYETVETLTEIGIENRSYV